MEFERSARVACLFQPVGGGLRYEAVHFLTFQLLSQLDWGLRLECYVAGLSQLPHWLSRLVQTLQVA